MMNSNAEVVSVQIGNAGNNTACMFWKIICDEHCIGLDGSFPGANCDRLIWANSFFRERGCNEYFKLSPRCVLVDADPDVLQSKDISLFDRSKIISGKGSTGNNFGKAVNEDGKELLEVALEAVNLEVETCDKLHAFNIWHATGGGTGSGVGGLVMRELVDMYPKSIVNTITVIPSGSNSDIVVEPYNATLAFSYLKDVHSTMVVNNERLESIAREVGKRNSGWEDLNYVLAHTIAGLTSTMRFAGIPNTNLRKICTNVIPLPELHFLCPTLSPAFDLNGFKYRASEELIAAELIANRNSLALVDRQNSRHMAMASVFRGHFSQHFVEYFLSQINADEDLIGGCWMHSAFCSQTSNISCRNAAAVINTTGITLGFEALFNNFELLLKKRSFLHWYLNEGLEEEDFKQARLGMLNTIDLYKSYV